MRVALNGHTNLPPGTIATIVTYLEMRKPPQDRPSARDGWSLVPLAGELLEQVNKAGGPDLRFPMPAGGVRVGG